MESKQAALQWPEKLIEQAEHERTQRHHKQERQEVLGRQDGHGKAQHRQFAAGQDHQVHLDRQPLEPGPQDQAVIDRGQ